MHFSSLKNTSGSLFPLGSLLQMLPLCSIKLCRLTHGKPGWHFFFSPKEENFISNSRFPAGEPVLTLFPVAEHNHIYCCGIKNCFFLSAPFQLKRALGKHSPLTHTSGIHRTCLFYWSIPPETWESQKNTPSKCNDGVIWYCSPKEENSELQSSVPRTLYYTSHPGNALKKVKPQATEGLLI